MPIAETFSGFIETTTDALLIFEACRRGKLPKISRRLQDRERGSIKSGTVFVFDERESGIKRWTDGLVWSPSRILGNFLIYRELDGRESLHHKMPFEYNSPYFSSALHPQQQYHQQGQNQENDFEPLIGGLSDEERNRERNLVGSLTDTYKFRKGGLIKKTISIHMNGSTQHMISYYTRSDVLKGRLHTPSSLSELSDLKISPELLLKQSFRVPPSVEFAELMLKRPSLSPSSTNSTASTTSTLRRKFSQQAPATASSHYSLYESQCQPRETEDYHSLSLDHSRRLSFESIGNSRKYARMSIDDQYESLYRRSSLSLPSHSSRMPVPPPPSLPPPPHPSIQAEKIRSFPPLPPPPRSPHRLYQHHERKDVATMPPTLPTNDVYTRSSNTANSTLNNNSENIPFDSTTPYYGNRIIEQQHHQQQRYPPLVSNETSNRSACKEAPDSYTSPFRFQKHDETNSPSSLSYERHNGSSFPSPSSLIWSCTNNATSDSETSNAHIAHHSQQQQGYQDGHKPVYYNRTSSLSSPPPSLAQTTAASFGTAATYNSPTTSTCCHRYDHKHHYEVKNYHNYYPSSSASATTIYSSQNTLSFTGNNVKPI